MINTLRSEWCKLTTTKAFYWTTLLIYLLSIGLTAVLVLGIKLSAKDAGATGGFINAQFAASSLQTLGFTVLIIQAVMVFTSEYRHGVIAATYAATPNRTVVILAKTILYAVIAAVISFTALLGSYAVSVWLIGTTIPGMPEFHPLTDESAQRLMWLVPLSAATLVALTMGVSVLIRQTAGAISLMLVWFLAFEMLIGRLPKVGATISHYLPFTNLQAFLQKQDLPDFFLNYHQSLWLYLLWCFGLLAISIVVANRRDA